MNIEFKTLWFEDAATWRGQAERKFNEFVEKHNLKPSITWKKGNEEDIEVELKQDYDLILMDYELIGTSGNVLIKKIRELEIYTDILFYSGNYEKMVGALYGIENDDNYTNIDPVDGVYFSDRKREELFPKLERVIDKIVRRVQDIVNLRGIVLDNVSGFESHMKNIITLAANKFNDEQIQVLDKYIKKELLVPLKKDYAEKIKQIEESPQALCEVIAMPDYIIDSYKKARLVGRVIKILTNQYGIEIDEKYNKFANVYNSEIIQFRNALGHAKQSNENGREVLVGEIDGKQVMFDEVLFRQMRARIVEYQDIINIIEEKLDDI